MKLAIVTQYPNIYQVKRLKEAAEKKDYKVEVFNIKHLIVEINNVNSFNNKDIFTYEHLKDFDYIIFRSVTKYKSVVIPLIRNLRQEGVKVFFNNVEKHYGEITKISDAIRFRAEKIPYPKTIQAYNKESFLEACDNLNYPILAKNVTSSKGNGIHKLNSELDAKKFLKKYGKKLTHYMLQEFIEYELDLRILIVGDKVVGAMQRIPQDGEYRANFSKGGKVMSVELEDSIKILALQAAIAADSFICGVDIITTSSYSYVLEVNRAPGFEGMEKATKIDIASIVLEECVEKAY